MLTPLQIETVIGMQQSSFMALQTTYLAWGTIFTVVFAYLGALYFFLRHTRVVVRAMSFGTFAFVLLFLVWATNIHFQQVQALLDAVIVLAAQEVVPQMTDMGTIDTADLEGTFTVVSWLYNTFFVLVMIGFAYLTFFYKWRTRDE